MTHKRYIPQKLIAILFAAVLAVPLSPLSIATPKADALSGSDFHADRIIDDSLFFNANDMTLPAIQNFLNSKVPVCDTNGAQPYAGTTAAAYGTSRGYPPPYICLKDYRGDTVVKPAEAGLCNGFSQTRLSAAEMIFSIAQSCGINPKVLITLLQKEQGLIADTWPWPTQYQKATGYACPDTATCNSAYFGLFNQLYSAARQFKRYALTPGSYNYIAGRNNYLLYSPTTSCGGSTIFIQNVATAALYNYTPYQPNTAALSNLYGTGDGCSSYGNRNFWRLYTEWFGSTITGVCYNGVAAVAADVEFRKYDSRVDSADFIIKSGSGSGCVESHVMNSGLNSWKAHIASNQPGVNTLDTTIAYGKLDSSATDYPVLFGLTNTGSGKIEAHVWNKDLRSFLVHTASNQPTVNPANNSVTLGDLNGDGIDEPILIAYRNTGSTMIEFHGWGAGMQSWSYHIATNREFVDPANIQVVFADLTGSKKDQAILVAESNTGSGMIEFHIWNPGQWSWQNHIASNMPAINTADSKITFADIDGDGKDEAILIGLRHTGSGMIEFHIWNPGFTSWRSHIISNQPAF